MNATFISVDGTGIDVRYNTGIRNRGHGSRTGPPNNQHVAFLEIVRGTAAPRSSFNCRNTLTQIMGSAVFRMAGMVAAYMTPVQLRINGNNLALAYPAVPCMGSMPASTQRTASLPSSSSATIRTATSMRASATTGKPNCGTWGPTPIRTTQLLQGKQRLGRMTGPTSFIWWTC